ncbi:hypothetical protein BDV95DRAFT_99443 [Massariosphaeria phaeospora]|uniref:Extracellular membrane protein CFEM domain-containing protein n=1 Tax=Massariosphaeria phaeospora TaxID=100035 RepID=A0A7C8I2W4_9PLEO|nr:hypothetical protein BDV95DRAFT_99443 [Massariosphaeria phaeospora]
MKYSTVLLSFVVGAFAIPQDASITSAPAAAASGNLTPSQSCAIACTPGDVTCQAACLGIARPNESQVIGTNECAAKCDQGDGSPEATQKFSDCVQGCIGSLFPSSQTVPLGQQASNAASQVASNKAQPTGTDAAAGTAGASTGWSSSDLRIVKPNSIVVDVR